jgi:hypothetical protein
LIRAAERIMFEKHKEKKAEKEYEAEVAAWQSQHDELTAMLQAAKTRQGYESSDLLLKPGESIFGTVATPVSLRSGAVRGPTRVALQVCRSRSGRWAAGPSAIG